jgi:hypothetical protein
MEGHPDIRIITVPYDSGHQDRRMGAGPQHLLDNGLGASLRPDGRGVTVTTVRHQREPPAEVATAFELQDLVSRQVRAAVDEEQLPLGRSPAPVLRTLASSGSTRTGSSTRPRRPRQDL